MADTVNLGIIGDYDEQKVSHPATNAAIRHASRYLAIEVDYSWLPTELFLTDDLLEKLGEFDAYWISSGSPYKSYEGSMRAIKTARESGKPFFSTWGGFQYALLEYAVNAAGIENAGHLELDPETRVPVFILASCPVDYRPEDGNPRLLGNLRLKVTPGTLAYRVYGKTDIEEAFFCSYELNPNYRAALESGGLIVSGEAPDGGTRIVELPRHPFYLGTGFVPQLSSTEEKPHPLVKAFLQAAVNSVKS